eukprot:CAMPEP_0196572380 /NCGR_PEP_ID=MMETSP1081-20130531/2445_1 /TAXON_ID=36882 /ORGANISM="Pyramimonas amylifera, Strain CCMP720" /LENGTH=355 /DNA_ID=CAMNT_0041889687 /DNA_START=20 /DNA_END=1087 /DNA_ORIENTATION=-
MAAHKVPKICAVTGGSGFVGRRLVEMLVDRGAQRVVSFDIAPKPTKWIDPKYDSSVEYIQGNLTDQKSVTAAFKGVECVFHIAALVGPYHPVELYEEVNYTGTLHVIQACKELGIRKIVMSSSPSTRFDGGDINGKTEDELPIRPPGQFLQAYAETKAKGEMAMRKACDGVNLLTIAVAPHQVYGPRDMLFLHNFLKTTRLRIFGSGKNKCSCTHVDNYCHGLILGERALYPGSPALGKFYIVTDGPPQLLWDVIDNARVAMGSVSLRDKFSLPYWFIMPLAHACNVVGWVLGRKFKLTPFSVKMMVINRYFIIDAAKRDLGYEPVISFENGWASTIDWFKENWLPEYKSGNYNN